MGTSILPHEALARNGQPNAQRLIAWLTGLLTLALAVCAFILSFNALTDLAAKHGFSIPPLFPFVVEFAVIIFSLNALYRSLNREPAKWQWVLIIGSSLLAGLFNIAHANNDLLSRTMAAMPSLFLLLTFEAFLSLVKYSVIRQGWLDTLSSLAGQAEAARVQLDTLTGQITAHKTELDNLTAQLETRRVELDTLTGDKCRTVTDLNEARAAKMSERRAAVLSYLSDGLSPVDISSRLNVSLKTIKRDIAALNGQVRMPK